MTLNSFLEKLAAAPSSAPLIFRTDQGDVGAGYHVTEFKHSKITGIDCGAQISEWSETSVQILDGEGDAHMKVGKFAGILRQSLSHVAGLGEAPTRVEFAPGNDGLRTYEIGDPEIQGGKVLVHMQEMNAVCKPAGNFAGLCKPKPIAEKRAASRECCT